jgi:Tol biopolymer transport system component/DNA-binding winged helix-turn-helix (wHTH) protein
MSSEKHLYEFGEFRLDTAERLLLRNGEPVSLPPKVFDTLVVLVQNGGHLLDKEKLMRELWPDAFVEDVNLSVNISVLRKALGESDAGEGFIQTVPKRGYRFVAQVTELDGDNEDLIVHSRIRARVVTEETEASNDLAAVRSAREQRKELEAPGSLDRRFVQQAKPRHPFALVALVVLVIAIAGAAFGLYKLVSRRAASAFERMKVTRLTNSGKAVDGAISPDGKYVVYVLADSGQQSLWLRQVAAASNVQIVPPSDLKYDRLTFSSDGNFIYYVSKRKNIAELYQMPALGGAARKLIEDIDSLITISPDSTRLAFLRGYPSEGQSALMVANADGTSEQKLTIRQRPDFFSATDDNPAWSPDGTLLACPAGTIGAKGSYMFLLGVRTKDGSAAPLTSQHWWRVGRMAWLRDGKGLIFTAQEQESSPSQIWQLSYPSGDVHRITNDLNDYSSVSVTGDGASLVTVQSGLLSSIWIGATEDLEHAKRIQSNNADGLEGIAWTPDGRVVFASRATGHSDIWITNQDGSNQKRLTADGSNNKWPVASADGRYIVFMSNRAGPENIWRIDIDGNNVKQLTAGGNEWFPDCSPDSQWVVYRSGFGKRPLFRVPIDGGEPVPINDRASSGPAVSPDGKWIACAYFDDPKGLKTAIYPFTGGEPARILNLFSNFYVNWTPDSHALAYISPRSNFNLESQPIDGGQPTTLTKFTLDRIFRFAFSRDGKQLAMTRGNLSRDVVLISNFK